MKFLGQDPDRALFCVYCGREADTWDHLVGLVRNKQLCGYGHQLGNLVPCCKVCNSRKGSKDWGRFLDEQVGDKEERRKKKVLLKSYLARFAKPLDLDLVRRAMPEEWGTYASLKDKMIRLMADADRIASKIRERITQER